MKVPLVDSNQGAQVNLTEAADVLGLQIAQYNKVQTIQIYVTIQELAFGHHNCESGYQVQETCSLISLIAGQSKADLKAAYRWGPGLTTAAAIASADLQICRRVKRQKIYFSRNPEIPEFHGGIQNATEIQCYFSFHDVRLPKKYPHQ